MLQLYITSGSFVILFFKSIVANTVCSELPQVMLTEILGGAFNSRYMSFEAPQEAQTLPDGSKRYAEDSFFVSDNYSQEIGNATTWNTSIHEDDVQNYTINEQDSFGKNRRRGNRFRRNSKKSGIQRAWDCDARVVWTDLGMDYFPRYLRSVKCGYKKCWYGQYRCVPRAFTVKLLKRKRGRCVESSVGAIVGAMGLPIELRELWVWEERAVNFCCDCVAD